MRGLLFTLISLVALPLMSFAEKSKGVVVSIKPLHSLVTGVIGDTGKATLLLKSKSSPHDFQLKPSQMKLLNKAKVVFYIDERFEVFLNRVFKVLPNHIQKSPIIQTAGLKVLPRRKGRSWEIDEHDNLAYPDMHVWLDPNNAKKIVIFITEELSKVYPQNRRIYEINASQLIARLTQLDLELQKSLSVAQERPFIVFHDAYQYFERAYQLNAVGSITFEPNEFPKPKRLLEIRKKLQQTTAVCVFSEPQFSPHLIAVVTENIPIRKGNLDPLGATIKTGRDFYFVLLEQLSQDFKQGLNITNSDYPVPHK